MSIPAPPAPVRGALHQWDIGRYVTTCAKCGCDPLDAKADQPCPGSRPTKKNPRPEWLPDDAATHWPNGDPVSVRDVLDARLIREVPAAFWLHALPIRDFSVEPPPYVPPRVVEYGGATKRYLRRQRYRYDCTACKMQTSGPTCERCGRPAFLTEFR